jgi:hypothetical protein
MDAFGYSTLPEYVMSNKVSTRKISEFNISANLRSHADFLVDFRTRYYRDLDTGCWIWLSAGAPGKYGFRYGAMVLQGKTIRATKYSYENFIGPVQDGMLLCHKCDNPPCVNPGHLFIGTAEDNTQDKVNKDRHLWGEKHPKAKLTKDKVEEIRYMIASGLGVSEVGRMMRIPKQRISEISNYKRWKRMTD